MTTKQKLIAEIKRRMEVYRGYTEDFNIREYEYGTILFEQSAERYDRLRIAGYSCLV